MFWGRKRSGDDKQSDPVVEQLQAMQHDLQQTIDRLQFQVNQLRQESSPARSGTQRDVGKKLGKLLDAAAGVAYAEISCHRDMYDFVVAQAARTEHFRLPAVVTEKKDLIEARLSGRSLVAILKALNDKRYDEKVSACTQGMAKRAYKCIKKALGTIERDATRVTGGQKQRRVVRIVIDDRPAATA